MMYRWQPAAVGNEPSVLPLRNLWFARSDRFFSHFKPEIPARLLYCIERRSACYDLYFYAIPLSYKILPDTSGGEVPFALNHVLTSKYILNIVTILIKGLSQ